MTKTETKTVPTKAEIAKEARADKAIKSIKADAAEIAKHEKAIDRLQTRIGKTAIIARKNGVTFAVIADAAGRSVAWLQTELKKVGYEPRAYNKTAD